MKAMILCAGKGTRLRPMTLATPKPMIPLIDKPVLQYIVEHLRRNNIDEIAVNLSYMPDEITSFFRDGSAHGVDMFYSYEGKIEDGNFVGEAVGSAGGLKKIQNESAFFDDTFVVLCGDAAINMDIESLVKEHKQRNALASIILKNVDKSEVSKYGIVALDDHGRIKEFQEKPEKESALSTLANTGIYIFEPEIFEHIPDGVEFDLGGDLFPALSKKSDRFYGTVADFDWIDIGNLKDFSSATATLLELTPKDMDLPGREVRPGIRLGVNVTIDLDKVHIEGPVYIGAGSTIEPGARLIGPTVIGPNNVIGSNAIIHQSVLGPLTRVRANTFITSAIVYGGYLISASGDHEPLQAQGPIGDVRERLCDASAQTASVANLDLVDQIVSTEMTVNQKMSA